MRWSKAVAALLLVVMAAGCASLPAGHVADARDPWERYNRAVFEFNEQLDQTVIKPVATAYRDYVPDIVQTTLRNFFGNLKDIFTALHHLLQGKPSEAGNSAVRVMLNTTIGFLGLGDPASSIGFQKSSEDFGQTFGVWGAGPGPYFILPVLGPSTVRDTFGLVLDMKLDPIGLVIDDGTPRTATRIVLGIDRRAELLSAESTIESISFDRYMGIRNAYLARRRSQIYDGSPPPEKYED